jgi:phosphoribosyl-ATP pyrophosphohydrolase
LGKKTKSNYGFISALGDTIQVRRENADSEKSYVASLFKLGINKIAQKVGEEAVEVVIEAKDDNDDLFFKRKLICFSLLNFASSKRIQDQRCS